MDKERIKLLIEFSSTVEEANDTIVAAGFTSVEDKIGLLIDMFGIQLVGRCDGENTTKEEVQEMDYYAILSTVISCRWGA